MIKWVEHPLHDLLHVLIEGFMVSVFLWVDRSHASFFEDVVHARLGARAMLVYEVEQRTIIMRVMEEQLVFDMCISKRRGSV